MEENKNLEMESIQENEEKSSFDFATIYTALILNWKWFVLSLIICMGAAQSLMPRKIGLCIFHADGLRLLTNQVVVSVVFRIVADDVMVAFDFIVSVVLVILLVQQFAFKVKGFGITVQSLKVKFIPEHHIPVFIKDRNQMKFIMLVFQIVDGTPIIGIFTCDVF